MAWNSLLIKNVVKITSFAFIPNKQILQMKNKSWLNANDTAADAKKHKRLKNYLLLLIYKCEYVKSEKALLIIIIYL